MASLLLKQSLVRAASTVARSDRTSDSADSQHARAFQALEVAEWLESIIDTTSQCNQTDRPFTGMKNSKWYNSRSGKLCPTEIDRLAKVVAASLMLPSGGIITQMIKYAEKGVAPALRHQLDSEVLTTALGSILWIACTSTFEQLLVLIFGIYDVDNSNAVSASSIQALLQDLFDDSSDGDDDLARRVSDNVRPLSRNYRFWLWFSSHRSKYAKF